MASFKGIKERINSVRTTRKITSAMKMVSSAKLHRAQRIISNMLPYSDAMQRILTYAFSSSEGLSSPLTEQREVKNVAIIAFSSDSSLAGSFNSNVAKALKSVKESYSNLSEENIRIYTIGKKVFEASGKCGYSVTENFEELASKPDYDTIGRLANKLTAQFTKGEIDKVELIYHHFKSAGAQILTRETFLPLCPPAATSMSNFNMADYIFEPPRETILETLLPQSLRLKLYTVLLDSNASEHGARVIAMQAATDNADDLISDLTIEYNKSRQQAITAELLDILGGQL